MIVTNPATIITTAKSCKNATPCIMEGQRAAPTPAVLADTGNPSKAESGIFAARDRCAVGRIEPAACEE
jgi:hypothetical protein